MCYVYTTTQTIYLVTLTMHTQQTSICVIPLSLISSPYQRANNGRNIYLHGETPLLLQVVDVHDNCPTSSCSCKHQTSAVENLRIAFFSSQKRNYGYDFIPQKSQRKSCVVFYNTRIHHKFKVQLAAKQQAEPCYSIPPFSTIGNNSGTISIVNTHICTCNNCTIHSTTGNR